MAVFWVQQYFTLPVILEDIGMSDEIPLTQQPQLIEGTYDSRRGTYCNQRAPRHVLIDTGPSPQHSLASSTTHQQQQQPNMEFDNYSRQHFGIGQYPGASALDMGGMANALPDYQLRSFPQQQFSQQYQPAGGSNPSMMYQFHQGAQFAGQTATNFNPAFPQQYQIQAPYAQQQPRMAQAQYQNFQHNAPFAGGHQTFQNQPYVQQQHHHHHQQQQPMLAGTISNYPQPQKFLHPTSHPSFAPYGTTIPGNYQLPNLRVDSNLVTSNVVPFHSPMDRQGIPNA